MAEEQQSPAPTFRQEPDGEQTRYVCVVLDAGQESGQCGWWSRDREYMEQHQHQRHAGYMIEQPAETPAAAPATPAPATSAQARSTPAPAPSAPPATGD